MHTNFTNTKIKVALVVRTKMWGQGGNGGHYPLFVGVSGGHPLINIAPINDVYPNLTETATPYSYNPWDPDQIDGVRYSWDFGANSTNADNTYEFITPLVPLNFIYDLQGEMTLYGTNFQDGDIWGINFNPAIEDVRLKFFIDFESTDIGTNGLPNKSNLIFTYPMTINYTDEFAINPVIDLNQGRPNISPVSQSEISQFCTGQLQNSTYHAKELDALVKNQNKGEFEIKNTSTSKNCIVFPNPANTQISIQYNLSNTNSVSIHVFNIYMQEILNTVSYKERNAGNYIDKLNIAKLAAGTYFIKINIGNKTETIKFIKL
jgi:hypothetical protein